MEVDPDLFSVATGLAGFLALVCLIVMGVRGGRSRMRSAALYERLRERDVLIQALQGHIAALEQELARQAAGQSRGDWRRPSRPEPEPDSLRRDEIAALSALGLPIKGIHSRDVIQKAYRTNIKRAHPDHGGTAGAFQAVREARDFLIKNHPVRPGL